MIMRGPIMSTVSHNILVCDQSQNSGVLIIRKWAWFGDKWVVKVRRQLGINLLALLVNLIKVRIPQCCLLIYALWSSVKLNRIYWTTFVPIDRMKNFVQKYRKWQQPWPCHPEGSKFHRCYLLMIYLKHKCDSGTQPLRNACIMEVEIWLPRRHSVLCSHPPDHWGNEIYL